MSEKLALHCNQHRLECRVAKQIDVYQSSGF